MPVDPIIAQAKIAVREALEAEHLSDDAIKRVSRVIATYGASIARFERAKGARTGRAEPTGEHRPANADGPFVPDHDRDREGTLGLDALRALGLRFGFTDKPDKKPPS